MKHLLLIFMTLTLAKAQAQYQYVPMPLNDTTIWHVRSSVCYQSPPHITDNCIQRNNMFMLDGSDTIINGYTYKKIKRRYKESYTSVPHNAPQPLPAIQNADADKPDDIYGYVREENKRIIVYTGASTYIAFDFNFAVGQGNNNMGEVTAIDTILFNGSYRKRFLVTQYYWHSWNDTIIEGMGSFRNGLFYNGDPSGSCGMDCFSVNDTVLYTSPAGACSYIFPYGTPTSVATAPNENNAVYPNPFNDFITVEEKGTVQLYNSIGVKVLEADTGNPINTSALASGMYFMVLKDKNAQIIQQQKVIKE